jgi:diaminohydroxyphosphoribosylaminopyrimidine deaminase/5-amino-6-(5-phosphoribosylamino)uracil reductase
VLRAPGECVVAVGRDAPAGAVASLQAAGATVLRCPGSDGRVDLRALLEALSKRDRINVLVEGGGELVGSFFDAGFADRLLAFLAPVVIGGRDALPAVGGRGAHPLAAAWRLQEYRMRRLGRDLLVDGLIDGEGP